MPVTLKCPDCGHTAQSDDGEPMTCPECEGTMATPPKKKYQAKSSSLEDEERVRKKTKRRDEDDEDDEDDEKPKAKKKARVEDEDDAPKPRKKAKRRDDDDEKGGGDFTRDGKAAEQLGLSPGFKNKALMKQVEEELSRGEVLHFVCRPSKEIAKKQGFVIGGLGALFALIGVVFAALMLTVMKVPIYAVLIPVAFVLIGGLIAVLGPVAKSRQARLGWYAVTDRRAIVFNVALWGKTGHAESYSPTDLRKMWVKKSFWVKGGGDLVFKTVTTYSTHTTRDARGRSRTQTSQQTQYYGFLGIEDVKDVELLIHEVLLGRGRKDDDDEDDD
jgi:hypothetical protein